MIGEPFHERHAVPGGRRSIGARSGARPGPPGFFEGRKPKKRRILCAFHLQCETVPWQDETR